MLKETSVEHTSLPVLRVAAVGDIHFSASTKGTFAPSWQGLVSKADIFLLCGDLTKDGRIDEIEALINELAGVNIPVIAVLGNHDYESGYAKELANELQNSGVWVLDGSSHTCLVQDHRVGVAGVKGFCGGFPGARAHHYGEPEMKAFCAAGGIEAEKLKGSLVSLDADLLLAITHYAPIASTVEGEPVGLFPFLGDARLEHALNSKPLSAAFHGHAHNGTLTGRTSAGVPVYNVAYPLHRCPFRLFSIPFPTNKQTLHHG